MKLPIKRLQEKQYLFGTKKISAEIKNDLLLIRVGGGFMTIDEFVKLNSERELKCLKFKMKKENKDFDTVVDELVKKYKSKHFNAV